MRLPRIIRTATFRLAALYVLLFASSVAVLGVIVYLTTAAALDRRLDARIAGEMATLKSAFEKGGLVRLEQEVRIHQRTRPAGPLDYLVFEPGGARLAGDLPIMPGQLGWSNVDHKESDGDISHRRVLTAAFGSGVRLAVAADREQIDELEEAIFNGFASAFAAVIALGSIGGIALSLVLLNRVDSIRRTAEAIIAGDLSQRVPVRGTNDDFDRLSRTLNRMLDRITELMESLRQVSTDIAHDLKTPLARLRQRLETAQKQSQSDDGHNAAIESAIGQVDEILGIFGALLRIAQIEAGTRRSGFRELDLSAVFANVIDAFAPAAEDAGKRLDAKIKPAIRFVGDRELLTQMLANLIENAIRHTPDGTRIEVSLGSDRDHIIGIVSDNGPGTPAEERERIFQRFYRLEHSRSTPGSGLGLSLVKAVADLHGIALDVRDAEPGLQIVMRFPTGDIEGETAGERSSHSAKVPERQDVVT
ncbi:MAG: ATP-binding protein [Pseudolabrys sp.]